MKTWIRPLFTTDCMEAFVEYGLAIAFMALASSVLTTLAGIW